MDDSTGGQLAALSAIDRKLANEQFERLLEERLPIDAKLMLIVDELRAIRRLLASGRQPLPASANESPRGFASEVLGPDDLNRASAVPSTGAETGRA